MNAKSTVETLNGLVRQVFRTFYPESFIVVNELLRQSEYVYASRLAANLNLAEPTVAKALNDLRQKRFVTFVKYKELPLFWAFDYHAFVNIVRYKVHMLKKSETAKGASLGGGPPSAGGGGYVCLKCDRALSWEGFVKLAAAAANGEPVCPQRGCAGPLMRESKRAAEGLRPLEQLGRALQRLDGAEIPLVGRREMERIIAEEARREDEARPEGGPRYEAPSVHNSQSRVVLQLAPPPAGALTPPELAALAAQTRGPLKARPLPPWLRSRELAEEQGISDSGENDADQEAKNEQDENEAVGPNVILRQAMAEYEVRLPHQLEFQPACPGSPESGVIDTADDLDASKGSACDFDWPNGPDVMVAGQSKPAGSVGRADIARMTVQEYEAYYKLYEAELHQRMRLLMQNSK